MSRFGELRPLDVCFRPEADIGCLYSLGGSYWGCASTPTSNPKGRKSWPNDSLGGVLNFKKKQQKERWTLGEEKVDQSIREHRALLEPIIAAAHPDPGVVA